MQIFEQIFLQTRQKFAGILSYGKNFSRSMQQNLPKRRRATPHKDCAIDASSNFSSDETKSGVNTWCIHEHFCEIWESVSYLTYADCVVRFFERWREKRRKSFVDFRVFSRNISENMHARCVREDTKQALKGNLQADGVQSRQTLFVRYCRR